MCLYKTHSQVFKRSKLIAKRNSSKFKYVTSRTPQQHILFKLQINVRYLQPACKNLFDEYTYFLHFFLTKYIENLQIIC